MNQWADRTGIVLYIMIAIAIGGSNHDPYYTYYNLVLVICNRCVC